MKSSVEPLEGNKVKLTVEVDEAEFDRAVDSAFKRLAREVRVPGFRQGRAPRRVLEARLGADAGRSQALHDSLPEYYADAVREHDVDVIAPPEIEITSGEDAGPVAFEAVVEVRPVIEVPGYGGLRVTIDSPEPSEEEVDEQLERLRRQFGELEQADRPAVAGDYVTIDVAGSQDGEEIEQLTAEDYLYELGSGGLFPEVDEQLVGAKPGDIFQLDVADPRSEGDDRIDLRVLVKEVQVRVLPDLDDEFANEASEFESLDELRADLRRRLGEARRVRAVSELRERTGEALAELVTDDIPEALVRAEMSERLQDLSMRLEAQGITIEQWAAITGRSASDVVTDLEGAATTGVRVDLALRAVADAEQIECTEEDLDEEIAALARRLEIKPAEVRRRFERAEGLPAVRSDIRKRKAFEWLLERVEIVDPDGKPIDRSQLEPPDDSADETATDTAAESATDTPDDSDEHEHEHEDDE